MKANHQMDSLTSATKRLALTNPPRSPAVTKRGGGASADYLQRGGKADHAARGTSPMPAGKIDHKDYPTIKAMREGLAQQRPASPKRKPVPQLTTGARLLDQCLPNCLPNRAAAGAPSDSSRSSATMSERRDLLSSPTARIVKRPNGQYAHLLELPPSVPYALRLHSGSNMGTVHVVPCLTPEAAKLIREDAERSAARMGG